MEKIYKVIIRAWNGTILQKAYVLAESAKEAAGLFTNEEFGEYDRGEVKITARFIRRQTV